MTPLDKAYDPKPVEARWVERWEKAGLFRAVARRDRREKDAYVVVIPPPNITGSLHMGHALNNVLQDALVRYHRLAGKEALWVPGVDHGGIATQNVVEKMLKKEGKTRHDLGREGFLERMWVWRKEVGDTILMQLTRLGCALDLSRNAFTMDEPRAAAVRESFLRLWGEGAVYRGERMINWCVRCGTALSDIEVEHEERKGHLWRIRYPTEDGSDAVVVATTRPETMLGDTAVAVAPGSKKWRRLVGKKVRLPLADRLIPVIEDEAVDEAFGEGALKITPAHDLNDHAVLGRHPEIGSVTVVGFDGKLTEAAGRYAGLSREEALKKVLEDLQEQGFLMNSEPYRSQVPTCYRCNQIIEPLVSQQWFVRMEGLAKPAAEAAEAGEVRFHPERWRKPFMDWLAGIQDWCISRQIWWGHRIPVWYCAPCLGGDVEVSVKDAPGRFRKAAELLDLGLSAADIERQADRMRVRLQGDWRSAASNDPAAPCGRCGRREWLQDPDVLDTWFSSALWPFSVFGWPEKTPDLAYFYPTTALVTGYEILYLWVARMVMSGLHFLKAVPFKEVYIHGIVRDKTGKKMSKSLGNVVDPLSLMESYGTDAVRMSLITQAYEGKDIPFAEDSPVGARNFANKLWNSTRFVLMNLPEKAGPLRWEEPDLELADRWILSRWQRTAEMVRRDMEAYDPASAAILLYQFVWDEFCDWYIELAKIRLQEGGAAAETPRAVLVEVLAGVLKLLHPFMPFVTEELWQAVRPYAGGGEFLLGERLPEPGFHDPESTAAMPLVQEATIRIRTTRALLHVPPGMKLKAVASGGDERQRSLLMAHRAYIMHLARLESLEFALGGGKPPHAATAVVGGMSVYLPLEGTVDFAKERARLAKELEGVDAELARLDARLSNKSFVERAPESEVRRVEDRKAHLLKERRSREEALESLG